MLKRLLSRKRSKKKHRSSERPQRLSDYDFFWPLPKKLDTINEEEYITKNLTKDQLNYLDELERILSEEMRLKESEYRRYLKKYER